VEEADFGGEGPLPGRRPVAFLEGGRAGGAALAGVAEGEDAEGFFDVGEGAHAGREDDRRLRLGDGQEERGVGDFAGGYFDERQAEVGQEEAGAGGVEGAGEELDAAVPAVADEDAVVLFAEFEPFDHVVLGFAGVGEFFLVFGFGR